MTIIQTPTPAIAKSEAFYQKLNWEKISSDPIIYTDGKVLVLINPTRSARAGLVMYKSSWVKEKEIIGKQRPLWSVENGFGFTDPSGSWVYLFESAAPVNYTPKEKAFGMTGNAMGYSLESADMNASIALYETLGFKITMGAADQGFVVLANEDRFGISLMKPNSCPHLFFNPSLTYFNGKEGNPIIIENLRNNNIPITEEVTVFSKDGMVDNVIIQDPGGLGFFIFND